MLAELPDTDKAKLEKGLLQHIKKKHSVTKFFFGWIGRLLGNKKAHDSKKGDGEVLLERFEGIYESDMSDSRVKANNAGIDEMTDDIFESDGGALFGGGRSKFETDIFRGNKTVLDVDGIKIDVPKTQNEDLRKDCRAKILMAINEKYPREKRLKVLKNLLKGYQGQRIGQAAAASIGEEMVAGPVGQGLRKFTPWDHGRSEQLSIGKDLTVDFITEGIPLSSVSVLSPYDIDRIPEGAGKYYQFNYKADTDFRMHMQLKDGGDTPSVVKYDSHIKFFQYSNIFMSLSSLKLAEDMKSV